MTMLVIGYNVEWTKGTETTETFVARLQEVHERAQAPCTLYLLGALVRDHEQILKPLADHPLFDLQLTMSKPLKSICQQTEGETTVWRGATLEQIEEEIIAAQGAFEDVFSAAPIGVSGPMGSYRGLQDRPDILDALDRRGIRFCRTYARNERDWQPVDFAVEPFWYTYQGFPHILEFPAQGWQEPLLRQIYGWADIEGYLDYVKADADEAAQREQTVWSYWAQDWSVLRGTPDMAHIVGLIEHAQRLGMDIATQRAAYEALRTGEQVAAVQRNGGDADRHEG